MFVLLETGLDSVGDALGLLQVELHIDLGSSTILEVAQDLVLLLSGSLVVVLLTTVASGFQESHKLCILVIGGTLHLTGNVVLQALELVKKSLLFSIVVIALGNLGFHCITGLSDLSLLLGVLLVEVAKNLVDLITISGTFLGLRLGLVVGQHGHVEVRCVSIDVLDGVRGLQVSSNHLETFLLVIDRFEKGLDLIHLITEARTLILGLLVEALLQALLVFIRLLSLLLTAKSKLLFERVVLVLLPVGHSTINFFDELSIVGQHFRELLLVIAAHALLLEVRKLLLGSLESLIADLLAFLLDGLEAFSTLLLKFLLDSIFRFVFGSLNLMKFLLIMSIFRIFLIGDAFHDHAEFVLLGLSACENVMNSLILVVLLNLEGVINLSHLGVQVSHHRSLLLLAEVASVESLLEASKDLVLHLIILVELLVEG